MLKNAFNAESAEKNLENAKNPEKTRLTQKVSSEFLSAPSAPLRSLR